MEVRRGALGDAAAQQVPSEQSDEFASHGEGLGGSEGGGREERRMVASSGRDLE